MYSISSSAQHGQRYESYCLRSLLPPSQDHLSEGRQSQLPCLNTTSATGGEERVQTGTEKKSQLDVMDNIRGWVDIPCPGPSIPEGD